MARVVVEVMPKPEILDPQGKAVTGALERLGFSGLQVRQGKRFELEVEGDVDDAAIARVREAAATLLCNTVIENFEVHVEDKPVAEKAEKVAPQSPAAQTPVAQTPPAAQTPVAQTPPAAQAPAAPQPRPAEAPKAKK